MQLATDSDALLARFALRDRRLWQQQPAGGTACWATGEDEPAEPEEAGIFPLVHGVRSLALAGAFWRHRHGVSASRRWCSDGTLDANLGQELLQRAALFDGAAPAGRAGRAAPVKPVTGNVNAGAEQLGARFAQRCALRRQTLQSHFAPALALDAL
jgi:CBS domain-containing protein